MSTAVQRVGVILSCLVIGCWSLQSAEGCESDGRYVMGTVLEVTLCDSPPGAPQHTLDALFTSALRLDALSSPFSPDSAISFLNVHAGQGAFPAPPEVIDLLKLSQRYWRSTRGAFDVTVGPLMALWSAAGKTQTLPSPAVLRRARASVGSDKIQFFAAQRVALARADMAIDVGGIGKGYALDQMVRALRGQNIKNALLDFGQSSIWALGSPPDAPRWRLLVQRPDGRPLGVISLRDQALSISASFGQRFEIQGQWYGHIIDPRNGAPLRRDLVACIVAPDATQAEALSKALLILGETEGIALLERLPGVEGLLSEANGRQWTTSGWRRAAGFAPTQ